MARVLVVLLVWAVSSLWPSITSAHEFRPSVLSVEALPGVPGQYAVQWSGDGTPPSLEFDGGCSLEGELPRAHLQCTGGPLEGRLTLADFDPRSPEVFLRVRGPDGEQAAVLSASNASFTFDRTDGSSTTGFFTQGLMHIATGFDHLLFVLLVLLAAGTGPERRDEPEPLGHRLRRVALLLTGFTVAHSLTLGAVALGFFPAAPRMVEAWIAVSLVIASAEIVRAWRAGRAAHLGWGVVFVFGLVHGLGFAGAISELLGESSARVSTLLAFNLGIETGQLLFVGLLVGLALGVRGRALASPHVAWDTWPRLLAPYAVGTVAFAWTIERALAVLA